MGLKLGERKVKQVGTIVISLFSPSGTVILVAPHYPHSCPLEAQLRHYSTMRDAASAFWPLYTSVWLHNKTQVFNSTTPWWVKQYNLCRSQGFIISMISTAKAGFWLVCVVKKHFIALSISGTTYSSFVFTFCLVKSGLYIEHYLTDSLKVTLVNSSSVN